MKQEHTFSWRAITRIVTAAAIVYLLIQAIEVFLIILISLMLASALYPIVKRFSTAIPLPLASILTVLALMLPLVLIGVLLMPFIHQLPDIAQRVLEIIKTSSFIPESIRNSIDIAKYAGEIGSYIIKSTGVITNIVLTFVTVIFLTLYFLIDSSNLRRIILNLIPDEKEEKLIELTDKIAKINGQYIRGNLVISLICGVTVFVGLTILGVPYAAPLAVFAALTDLLPLIGAFIGVVPASIIGFSVNVPTGLLVLGLFIIYQQIENALITPAVFNKALDLSPALTFLVVLIGGSLFGIVGAFLALPIAASIPTVTKYWKENIKNL
jgi:predicted PurR-regulated permease PerM